MIMVALRLMSIVAAAAIAALAIGHLGNRCETCDLANIGRPYWFAIGIGTSLGALALCIARKQPIWPSALCTICVAGFGPWDAVPAVRPCSDGGARTALRIVTFNAWMHNTSPGAAARWLRQARPDVIVLVEAKGRAAPIRKLLAQDYPFQVACNAAMRCSTQILSAVRPLSMQPWTRGDAENRKLLSAAAMTLKASQGDPVTVVGIHLSRPLPIGRQQLELSTLSQKLAQAAPGPLVVAGDFNTTRDSNILRNFADIHGLARISSGPTWPTLKASGGFPSLIAIDHILVSRHFGVTKAAIGPDLGSDHHPVSAVLCARE